MSSIETYLLLFMLVMMLAFTIKCCSYYINIYLQRHKSSKLKKEQGVQVFIYFKKSQVVLGKKKTLLLECESPNGVFFIFVPRQHYNTFKTPNKNLLNVLQELPGFEKIISLINDDGKLSLNGNLIKI